MPQDELMSTALRLTTSMEALAALAALVRVETEGLDTDPTVHALLSAVAAEVLGEPMVAGPADVSVVGLTRALLRQAAELVEAPGRSGSWDRVDDVMLQGIGRLSGAIAGAVVAAEATLAGLSERLRAPGAAFLDVGTGTAWLAMAIARTYPVLRVVGIDVFEPALALARRNVADEHLEDRVELQLRNVANLDADGEYDAVWLPLPFLPIDVVPAAMTAAARALRPGGWLLPGTFAGPDDRLSELLVDLRTVRSGGHPWRRAELIDAMTAHGFADAQEVTRTWAAPVRLFAGRRT